MSLWSKPVSSIVYDDVAQFCQERVREGTNVDYKSEIPSDLEKIVAAFANTVGGMVIFGVATDGNNDPELPPVGMVNHNNFIERITQKCAAAIYPPILPNIGRLLDIPGQPTKKVAVVRVDESPEKPHAVDSAKKIYIRNGAVNEIATLHRIEDMIHAKSRSEAKAQFLFDRHMDRFEHFVRSRNDTVTAWWNICPLFPVRKLCQLDECRSLVPHARFRGPDGAWCLVEHTVTLQRGDVQLTDSMKTEYVGVSIYGDICRARRFYPPDSSRPALSLGEQTILTNDFLTRAQSFYVSDQVLHPGLLRVSMGYRKVRGRFMHGAEIYQSDSVFPDDSFETEALTTFEDFSVARFNDSSNIPPVLIALISDVTHAFNLPMPPSLSVFLGRI